MNDSLTKYWLGDATEQIDSESLIRLASHRRAIANMIRIITNKDIPVKFNLIDKSFMTNKVVVISARVNGKNYDPNVGLALHEGTHVSDSDLDVVANLSVFVPAKQRLKAEQLGIPVGEWLKFVKMMVNVVEDRRIDELQYKRSPGYRGYYEAMYNTYFYLPEIGLALQTDYKRQEDLDSYKFRVINITHPDTDLDALKGLREINQILGVNTISRLRNTSDARDCAIKICDVVLKYVECAQFKPIAPPSTTPSEEEGDGGEGQGGESMFDNDDLVAADPDQMTQGGGSGDEEEEDDKNDNEGENDDQSNSDETDGDRKDAGDSQDGEENRDGEDSETKEKNQDASEESGGESGHDSDDSTGDSTDGSDSEDAKESSNSQHGSEQEKEGLTEKQKKATEEAEKAQEDFLEGNVEKEGLTEEQNEEIEIMEEADVEVRDVDLKRMKYKVIVVHNMTKKILTSEIFPFKSMNYYDHSCDLVNEEAVRQGFILGKQLGNRLRVINEESYDTVIRQPHGKVVRRLLHELAVGETSIFSRTEKMEYEKSVAHITIDGSGSMSGDKFSKALKMAVAVAVAASMTDSIEVVISLRGNIGDTGLNAIVYDSRINTTKHIQQFFPYFEARTWTPEGICFEAIMDELIQMAEGRNAYFINLSDGLPEFTGFSGGMGVKYTKEAVEKIRKSGVEVLSYLIEERKGENETALKQFREMYGKDAQLINVESLTEIARSLNQRFLKREPVSV
jgi:ribosomal protein L18E